MTTAYSAEELFADVEEAVRDFSQYHRSRGEDLLLLPIPELLLRKAGVGVPEVAAHVGKLPGVVRAKNYLNNLVEDESGEVLINRFQQDLEILVVVLEPVAPEVS